ncbi:MAG: hypothetical protein GWN71_01200, partial [Gammaproteobacteria bacterium]|nr:SagB/ThcOx family dehydrogenase [Gemmatimonadota bacterium]NIU72232.1 hypothetical protein [Gammaproteobacteria bacterium]
QPLPVVRLSGLMSCLLEVRLDEHPMPKYLYASAGGLYPVQAYLQVRPGRVEGLAGGTYYYDPAGHRLVSLKPGADLGRAIHAPPNQPVFDQSA